jgi:hypothetical protein
LVVLGREAPAPYQLGEPHALAELSAAAKTDNPSLSDDQLEIYFTSERGGIPADVWFARRTRADLPFDAPELAREANSPQLETSPALSGDALTLWIASDRPGGLGDLDIWVLQRDTRAASWSAPRNLSELNSAGKDIPRPLGAHGAIMPIGSDRDSRGSYEIYFAARAGKTVPFERPEALALQVPAHSSNVDGFLSEDGLTLFFASGPAFGPADLFMAARRATDEPFGAAVALQGVNSASDERDPFLSVDGRRFYFSSDRSGQYEIYVTDVLAGSRP